MTEAVSRIVALSLRACPGILLLMAARLLLDALEERKVTKKMLLFSTVVERETT